MRQFSPDNPIARMVRLRLVDPLTGAVTPATTGTVTGFLSLSRASDAIAADGSLSADLTYIGNQAGRPTDAWMFYLPATVMLRGLLGPLFTGKRAFIIVKRTNARRVVEEIGYVDYETATVA